MTTIRSLADVVPGSCVRILIAAIAMSGCSSAYLEPSPTKTVVMPPAPTLDGAAPPANLDDQIVGFIADIVDLPPAPETKR